MTGNCLAAVALLFSVGNGKRNSYTYYKHEERLDQIPNMQSVPFMVAQLISQELHHPVINFGKMFIKQRGFTSQKKHCKSAEKVHRSHPSGYRWTCWLHSCAHISNFKFAICCSYSSKQ